MEEVLYRGQIACHKYGHLIAELRLVLWADALGNNCQTKLVFPEVQDGTTTDRCTNFLGSC